MPQLILAVSFFVGIHLLIAGTRLRDELIARFGEPMFRAGFSLLSVIGIVWVVIAYRAAPYIETWGQMPGFKPIAGALMLIAFLFAVAGITTRNPTAVGGEDLLDAPEPAHGILRLTRHPFLWGVSLWALTHLIANGDAAASLLFGSLLLMCLAGTRSIDAKRRRLHGERWDRFASVTSNVPFAAILERRNRLVVGEIGWQRIAGALLVYAVMLHLHARLFGVSPLS